MSHQEILWLLQSCWEALRTLGPIGALLWITYEITR
jgi:hypothetical protein